MICAIPFVMFGLVKGGGGGAPPFSPLGETLYFVSIIVFSI